MYLRLQRLQGSCVPRLIAAGSIEEGLSVFLALSDAGTSLYSRCEPTLDESSVITPQVQNVHPPTLYVSTSRKHDYCAGGAHGLLSGQPATYVGQLIFPLCISLLIEQLQHRCIPLRQYLGAFVPVQRSEHLLLCCLSSHSSLLPGA